MADTVSKAIRSRVMRAIKSTGTKPEWRLAEAFERKMIGYDGNRVDLPGKPDFVLLPEAPWMLRYAVFVHGCFWHCCPRHFRPVDGGRRKDWAEKFKRNVRRDRRVRRALNRLGYRTLVVWEHDLKTDEAAARAAARIERRLRQ